MKCFLNAFILFLVFIIAISLGVENQQMVTFNYLLAQRQFRLSLLLALFLGAGLLLGVLICTLRGWRTHKGR